MPKLDTRPPYLELPIKGFEAMQRPDGTKVIVPRYNWEWLVWPPILKLTAPYRL